VNGLSSSDSDEDSLPSLSDMIKFLTPRTTRVKGVESKVVDGGSPSKGRGGKEGGVKREKESSKMLERKGVNEKGRGRVGGGFRESFGGTLHEVDGD